MEQQSTEAMISQLKSGLEGAMSELKKLDQDARELSRDAERIARQPGVNHAQAMYAQAVIDTCNFLLGNGERPVTRVQ